MRREGVIVCVKHADAIRVKRAANPSTTGHAAAAASLPVIVAVRNKSFNRTKTVLDFHKSRTKVEVLFSIMKRGTDYIGVGVGAAIFNNEGKLFLTLRGTKAKNERGMWEIPGGAVEFGETLEEALKRELVEEYGVEIEIIELLDVCDHLIPDEHQHWVSPTYICKITKGEPKILEPGKCAAIGWFTREETTRLPLSLVTQHDLSILAKKFPHGFPKLT